MARIQFALVILLCLLVTTVEGLHRIPPANVQNTIVSRTNRPPSNLALCQLLHVRGGSGDEADASESDDESESDSDNDDSFLPERLFSEQTTSTLLSAGKTTVSFVGKLLMSTISAASRAVAAAFQTDQDFAGEDKEMSLMTKMTRVVRRMVHAAFHSGDESSKAGAMPVREASGNKEVVGQDVPARNEWSKPSTPSRDDLSQAKTQMLDFGNYLSKAYGVEATRTNIADSDQVMPVLGGTITDALRIARSKARLLVVMIPSSKPGSKAHAPDVEAIKSLLSAAVATVAERKARKSGQTGSYVIWGAKAGSAEAVAALKRIKATSNNSKGQKRPILAVVYPAQIMGSDGMPKTVPRLLAQHHCSPPPAAETMAAWLNALRKRHAKQYATMQLELQEVELHRERTEGYKDSIQSDRDREQREVREAEERRRKEEADRDRLEAILQRRKDLRQAMPDEPTADDSTALTIALRLADGRTGQRRFAADTNFATLFNWVDAEFDIERENVELTTLNGQRSFDWNASDVALSETGFSRMTALRVTEKKRTPTDN
ncbi:hypothetical protein MPSEU_000279500 [Mayamaea pseudoterrestris]|nr:hypothetical protein MPSEU_000279500 [Mayamaea pseudoterrestris]